MLCGWQGAATHGDLLVGSGGTYEEIARHSKEGSSAARCTSRCARPSKARPLLGRSPCGGCGPCTSRSRDHTKEGSSATRLGRSAWPSDHSVAAATVSQAGRRMTRSGSSPRIHKDRSPYGLLAVTPHPPGPAGGWVHSSRVRFLPPRRQMLRCSSVSSSPIVWSTQTSALADRLAWSDDADDRVRIAVTDPGSHLRPCMLPSDPETPGGLGLLVVDELCETWGAWQDLGLPGLVRAPARPIPALRGDHAVGKRTDA